MEVEVEVEVEMEVEEQVQMQVQEHVQVHLYEVLQGTVAVGRGGATLPSHPPPNLLRPGHHHLPTTPPLVPKLNLFSFSLFFPSSPSPLPHLLLSPT